MSIFGITKGTELENQIDNSMNAELRGVLMYHGLAYLAKERGLGDVAETLKKLAEDEAHHAGLYAVLNGKINDDIFTVLNNFAEVESNAVSRINAFAKQVRELGLEEAAEKIEAVALDEGRHGEVLKKLCEKHSSDFIDKNK